MLEILIMLLRLIHHLLEGRNSRDVGANTNPDIANAHRLFTNAKIVVPLKYISNSFRSFEMPLIN